MLISWSGDTDTSMLLTAEGVILHPDHLGTPTRLKERMTRKMSKYHYLELIFQQLERERTETKENALQCTI